MSNETVHVTQYIDRDATVVYDYIADPSNLPAWASGLTNSVDLVDGQWVSQTSWGQVTLRFAERNSFGIADHWVTTDNGDVTYNPLRVIPLDSACEVVFTLRKRPGMTEDDFQSDELAVTSDLAVLKQVLEG